MKRVKNEKKTMSKTKAVICCVVLGILAFGGTMLGLWLVNGNMGYKEALGYADEILKTKEKVAGLLDVEFTDLKLGSDEKNAVADFSAAKDEAERYMQSISESPALKNDKIAEKYESAKKEFEKIEKIDEIQKEVLGVLGDDGEVEESKLEALVDSKNDFLKKMAKDIVEYKKLAKEFAEKYADVSKVDEKAMIEDYGNFQVKGETIADNYAEIEFKDVFGFTKDEALKFYDSIEGLISILNEKI